MNGSEVRRLLRQIERAGIPIERTQGGHFRIRLSAGLTETIGSTPSRATIGKLHRLIKNARAGRARR